MKPLKGTMQYRSILKGYAGDYVPIGKDHKLKNHECVRYQNARGELIDPNDQNGIGCNVCRPFNCLCVGTHDPECDVPENDPPRERVTFSGTRIKQ